MVSSYLSTAREGRHETWRYIATLALVIWLFISVSLMASLVAVILTGTTDLQCPPTPAGAGYRHAAISAGRPPGAGHRIAPVSSPLSAFAHQPCGAPTLGLPLALLWLVAASVRIDRSNFYGSSILPITSGAADWSRFLPYALLATLLIPFQTSTEELIFRGYLTQWIGRSRLGFWATLILPNLIFALLHGLNPEVQTYGAWLTLPLYFGIGLVLSWATLQSGGLEYALGMHAANNFYAALVVTFPASALPSPALIQMRTYDPVVGLIAFTTH